LKWQAIANECLEMYNIGRPVLVGTTTIEKSELLAALLNEYKLPYRLLNARPENIESESEIISQAGCKNAITIATNMAGRGTDIVLGGSSKSLTLSIFQKFLSQKKSLIVRSKNNQFIVVDFPDYVATYDQALQYLEMNSDLPTELADDLKNTYNQIYEEKNEIAASGKLIVKQLGGLHVIGTERHESRRIDNQLRGRSGRQGDPGSSRFFLSLEDKLLRIFGGDQISSLMQNIGLQESVPIQSKFLNQSLESAQKKVETYYFDIRKKLFEYDEALNTQRNGVYIERRRILEIGSLRNWIVEYAERSLYDIVLLLEVTQDDVIKNNILQKVQYLLGTPFLFKLNPLNSQEQIKLISDLHQQFQISYALKEAEMTLIEPGLLRELERSFLLQQIDFSWKEHLQKISALRDAVGWRAYGQKDPLTEYKQEAYNFFVIMLTRIRHRVVYFVLRSRIIIELNSSTKTSYTNKEVNL
jgi:preprotein translocase subunit SecA